jgi:UDP-N-acetylmuramoylalanine--D-glutamate ligase
MNLRGRKITIMGLGRHGGGVAAARYCAQNGAVVTVTDLADRAVLAESLTALADEPIEKFTLGEHCEADITAADIVVVNPAVKPGNSLVELARQAGAAITSETELFLDACPAFVVGVSGTVGKSTTAAMLAGILKAGGRRAWLGGNIGHSLLADLPQIDAGDVVVLEISSFQLHWLNETAQWPKAVIVTNCSPNHLDWHGTWANYAAAKRRLISHLPPEGFAVLNYWGSEVQQWDVGGRNAAVSAELLETIPPLRVPGEHNRINAACAATAAKLLGVNDETIAGALGDFAGLPHRLRFVAEINGRRFYNDSKSTTPAATIAALNSMDRPTWLLLGGVDNRTDWRDFIAKLKPHVPGIAAFGASGRTLHDLLRSTEKHRDQAAAKIFNCWYSETLAEALRWCWLNSASGDVILLSPACPSTDQYRDFAQRGEEFEQLVRLLAADKSEWPE